MARCLLITQADIEWNWIAEKIGPQDCLVALGLKSYAAARNYFPQVKAIEEFLPHAENVRLAAAAYKASLAFARLACRGETLDGYDWPMISVSYQDYAFRDILFAETLSAALKRKGCRELVWVGNPGDEPCLYLPTTPLVIKTFRYHWGRAFEVWHPLSQPLRQKIASWRGRLQNGGALLRKRLLDWKSPKLERAQVVILYPTSEEWERFTEPMENLRKGFGEGFQLWSL